MFGTNTMVCDPNSIKAQIINVIDLSTVCFLEGCCLITGGRINYSVELSSQSRGVALEDQFSVLLLNLEGWHWRISFFIIFSIWRRNFFWIFVLLASGGLWCNALLGLVDSSWYRYVVLVGWSFWKWSKLKGKKKCFYMDIFLFLCWKKNDFFNTRH